MVRRDRRGAAGLTLILIAPVLALACASCASGRLKEFALQPEGGTESATARLASGLAAQARYLDQEAMVLYAREKGLSQLAYQLRTLKVLAFALTLSNSGTAETIVDPRGIRLFHGKGDLLAPLEYASLYMELPADSDRQQVLRDLQLLLFEGTMQIRPDGGVERMVLFPRPETFGKKGLLLLRGIYVNGVPAEMSLGFEAHPLD